MTVAAARTEEARATMIELFPAGFEEIEHDGDVELAAYTDAGGEERLWHAFGGGSAREVPEDWAERWRDFHRSVRVGALWVGPPWEAPPPDAVAVVIDPGRAFGTGAHATTRLVLELVTRSPRGSLLDLGCGSGVVAIAAAKLGFDPVTALDHDPLAVEATRTNAARNGVAVEVRLGELRASPLPPADVAVANITLETVIEVGPLVAARRLITSGYLESEHPSLAGYDHLERVGADGWAADLFARATD